MQDIKAKQARRFMAIVGALWLRVTGALDDLEKILPDKEV